MALDVQRAVWFRFRFLLFAIWPVRSMGGFGAVSCNFRFGSFSVDCGHQLFDFGETSGECIRVCLLHSSEKTVSNFLL